MTPPTRTDTTGFTRTATGLGVWAVAGAACGGLSWYGGLVLAEAFLDTKPYEDVTPSDAGGFALVTAGLGLAYGFLVGGAAALLFGVRGGPPFDRVGEAVAWAVGSAAAGAVGGAAAPYAIVAAAGALPAEVSSSLAWAAVGSAAGVIARLASWWMNETSEPDEDDGEQPAQPPGEGHVWVPPAPRPSNPVRRERVRSLLRLLPLSAASVLSLVAAAAAPSGAAPGLLAAGLIGLCATGALWGQENRVRGLERRTHSRP